MSTIPTPNVLLVLDYDLGDVTREDVDAEDQEVERPRLYGLIALIEAVINRERNAVRRAELYAKLEAFKARGGL